ncbi:conserved hypothetical protein [Trichormus variabilis ATCC 29413]|uniref:Uncharacterized protein n=2 Tax=Anabaena variabilis TaxID=264691 RepID=Q3MDF2_TRIV2|nr:MULTISPECIES: hypothetical protein [Nostocaceae]ABA20984.1 conserved hypothetical protein [Trichormus variabilis ATCC 29413]MBC1215925.1 hypothetical protein [Trichormus variabilis ARAD]MBC1254788.1 hypothetical protein [Trichormus variabilis V5]MBC1265656.1 hypothetical protein [Trichormus variabilis FSR]MBC1301673.1 hypothetical protein [Trichormus variabilis N2B]
MLKLVNPLDYPVAVLVGGVSLFVGVRLGSLPSLVMLPVAAGVTMIGAGFLKSRELPYLTLDNPDLEREINSVKVSALALANQANDLRLEARKLLTDSFQIELLAGLETNCDRAVALPGKIDTLVWNINGNNSLLSVESLQTQLQEVKQKLLSSSGVAKQHWQQLADSLRRNIKLAKEGEDTRLARFINISTLIQDSAGLLQRLQTKLRASDLHESEQINAMILLNDELNSLSENLELLVSK